MRHIILCTRSQSSSIHPTSVSLFPPPSLQATGQTIERKSNRWPFVGERRPPEIGLAESRDLHRLAALFCPESAYWDTFDAVQATGRKERKRDTMRCDANALKYQRVLCLVQACVNGFNGISKQGDRIAARASHLNQVLVLVLCNYLQYVLLAQFFFACLSQVGASAMAIFSALLVVGGVYVCVTT